MGWFTSRTTAPASARPNKTSRLLLQALEPRLMFDGAAVQTAIAALHAEAPHLAPEHGMAPAAAERLAERAAPPAAPAPEKQVVFVDAALANSQALLGQLPPGAEVVLLEAGQDGLAQIAQWAGRHHGYGAMHIVSHGQRAGLVLGGTALNTAALDARQGELAAIGGALRPGGDILLYGCDIGAGAAGAAFVSRLASFSHADVAASTDATGAARLGGNWTLERHSGPVEAAALRLDYPGLLAQPRNGVSDFNMGHGQVIVSGSATDDGLSASDVDGWDFTLKSSSATNCYIGAEALTNQTPMITGVSLDGSPLLYLQVKANNGALFTLTSVDLAMSGLSTGAGGTLRLIGYRNGVAVSGAILALSVTDVYMGGQLVTFNVSNNSAFQGIDAFRVQTDGSFQVTGAFGVDNLTAIDFIPPGPVLTPSGGDSAFSAGTGNAVAVDSGINVSDSSSSTLSSAMVSITGNFHAGQDVLAFNNDNPTLYGNISASYTGGTGVLMLSSSGGTATLAQWQAALRAITYQNTSLSPITGTRTVGFTVDDGSHTSTVVSKGVAVAPNAAPVIGNLHGDSVSYTAGGGPVRLDSGTALTVSDSDTPNFNGGSLMARITGNLRSGEDVLGLDASGAVSLSNGTSAGSIVSVGGVAIGSIASNGDGVGGHDLIVTLNGHASTARVSALAGALTYKDTAGSPNSATRTVQVVLNDGRGQSSAAASVTVAVINAPLLGLSGGSAAFVAGDNSVSTPVLLDGGLTVSDPGSSTLASATVAITGNFRSGEDVLAFANDGAGMGNIVGSYHAATGVLSLSSAGATATLAQWQAALRAVTYTDTQVTPHTATRTLSFQATDGSGNASAVVTRTLTVTATGQTPIATASGGSAAFTGGDNTAGAPVVVDGGITLSDLDNSTLASATAAITGNFRSGEDSLAFSNTSAALYGNIVASYNGASGVLTLTSAGATATLAQWQAALRAVSYRASAAMPDTATRTVSFTVSDGGKTSAAVSRQVTLASVAQSPVLSASGGSTAFASGDNGPATPVAVDSGLSLSDLDSATLASATVAITGNFRGGQDVLAFSNTSAALYGNIAASYASGTGVLTLTSAGATATLAQWQAALRAVSYIDSAATPDTATRTVSFSVNDGGKTSASAAKAVTVSLTSQSPIATTSGGSAAFTSADGAAGSPVAVDGGITLSDLDSTTLASATVAITGNFQSGEDVLAFSNTSAALYGNIAASYNGGTGVLTLASSGATATLAQWQAALRAVSYGDSQAMPHMATRTVSFSVNDGGKTSAAASRQVTLAAAAQTPLLTASAGSTAFASGDNGPAMPVAVDGGLNLSDLDSATLASATVAITGNFHGGEDVLAFSNGNAALYGNISASYDAATGVLSMASSGATATLAQWQAALRAVSYTDSAATPNTAARTVSFSVDDGGKTSASVSKAISISRTDQSPIVSVSGGSAAFVAGDNAASTPVLVDGGLSLSDLDSATLASASVSISGNFRSGQDVLALSHTSAASFGNITASYNSGTGVLSLTSSGATATLAQWQAALRAVSYSNSAVTPDTASRSISFRVNDGGKESAAVSRGLTLAATAQTPLLTGSAGSAAFTAGDGMPAAPVAVDTGLTLSDRDSTTLASARVAITGNFRSGEDVLAFSNTSAASFGNIVASYDGASGVLSLTSSGATATLAQWQAALRAVTYTDSAGTPALATRTVSFAVSDGSKTSAEATRSVTLALPDYTPVLGASGGQASFVVGAAAAPVVVDSGLQVLDRDSATLASAKVAITGNFRAGEDTLSFSNTNATLYGNITASYHAGGGELTLTSSGASASLAQWQAALRAVKYFDSAATPHMATRTVAFSINDGGRTSQVVTRAVALNLPTPQIGGLAAGSDTGASASDGVTANARPILTGSALASATVSVYVDGVLNGTATADGSGAWAYAFPADLLDGSHSVTVKARSGGSDSPVSSALALVIDTMAPASPADLKLTSGTAARPALSGKAEAGSSVSIQIDGVVVGKVQADGAGAWAWQGGSALADGAHSVRAVATDPAGNASAATAELKFTVDTRVPPPPAPPPALDLAPGSDTGSSASDGLTSQNRPTLSGTAQAGSTVTVLVDGAAAGSVRADANGAWRYTLGSALADGAHSIAAVAENAGGKSAPSAALALTIDTAAPGAPAIAGLGANPAQPEFSGSAEANSMVAIYVDHALAGTVQADAGGRWSYRPSGLLGEGAHTVRAVATDAAGNSGAGSAARGWSVDSAPPAIPAGLALAAGADTGGSASDGITRERQPAIVGTAAAGSRVTVSIDGVALGSVVADAQGAWRFRPGAALAEGAHRVTAVAANAAGAVSAASAPLLLTIDTGAPRLLAITPLDATATSAGLLRYEVQFSEAVALAADAFGLLLGGQAQAGIASITPSGEGRYIVQLSASGEGSVALTLRAGGASDLAGNALAQGGGGTAYQLSAPVRPEPQAPLTETRPGAGRPPPGETGGPAQTIAPLAPAVPVIVSGKPALVLEPALAEMGRLPTLSPRPAWGGDRFAGGTRGLVAREVQDLGTRTLAPGQAFEIRLPAGTLGARSAELAPTIHVQLGDGRPLPLWIRFDAKTGRFLGTFPPGWEEDLLLEVRVQDEAGHEHVTRLQLRSGGAVEAKADGGKPAPGKEAHGPQEGKAVPAKAALNEQLRQYGKDAFDQQLAAWLAADEAV
ncbi:Ig-like domain-containing protein [Pseudoduganella violacea]|uniref:DUF4347 domain-containing protein n=1 Tax=Pseudoduganella violacea TaxID=1715466 RepID=A0A7W5FSD7_9BURK|nr:Ig-like domain-containing protein [Pseudoduganella violacea]MBB3117620.1 hypothetical protein [Pseudoduganella violacea]